MLYLCSVLLSNYSPHLKCCSSFTSQGRGPHFLIVFFCTEPDLHHQSKVYNPLLNRNWPLLWSKATICQHHRGRCVLHFFCINSIFICHMHECLKGYKDKDRKTKRTCSLDLAGMLGWDWSRRSFVSVLTFLEQRNPGRWTNYSPLGLKGRGGW